QQYGMLLRRGFHATLGNIIATGFEAGVDYRNSPDTDVTIEDSIFFGNAPVTDPGLGDCFAATPDPLPASEIAGATPPSGGFFDTSATYVGAFKDGSDDWMTGNWVSFGAD